jgi:hypothetical protein
MIPATQIDAWIAAARFEPIDPPEGCRAWRGVVDKTTITVVDFPGVAGEYPPGADGAVVHGGIIQRLTRAQALAAALRAAQPSTTGAT